MQHSYPISMRVFHWAMAALILSMLFAGLTMVQTLAPWHTPILAAHKVFGVLALIGVIARLLNRLRSKAPALPADLPATQVFAAKATQVLLYAAMLLMPISGYLMVSASGQAIDVFGWFYLPALGGESLTRFALLREMHAYVAYGFILLLLMHIGGALYHGWVRQDGVLGSMLLGGKNSERD
ncbi:MAG: cytochrome b [Gammaproteobacteria bacterium]|nr:cytochrome b [Gammaproteobacteria bacterium]